MVYPSTITSLITATYIRKPNEVNWASQTVVGNALYNAGSSTSFELHDSEETNLVIKILLYVGLTLKAGDIAQVADAKKLKKYNKKNLNKWDL